MKQEWHEVKWTSSKACGRFLLHPCENIPTELMASEVNVSLINY